MQLRDFYLPAFIAHELDGFIPILQMRKLRLEDIEPIASGPLATQGRAGIWGQLNHVIKCECCGVKLSPGSLHISRATLNYWLSLSGAQFLPL